LAGPVATPPHRSFSFGSFGDTISITQEFRGLVLGGAYAGPGRSPGRADVCVRAMMELLRAPRAPAVRGL